ncbi:MAG: hypothetical protein EPO11_04200 [Gammaproteobacteria bacterium]|nr:MAG: hypothetical protein EPO11_04200 [Gammaproteobacteria bacterium]
MMLEIIGIIIALASPLLAVYLYYANKKFTQDIAHNNEIFIHKIHKEKLFSEKIDRVVSQFLDMYNSSKDTGISALIRSGIGNLDSNEDIQFVLTELEKRTGKKPLGKDNDAIKQVGLLKFFQHTDLNKFRECNGIENIIKELKE